MGESYSILAIQPIDLVRAFKLDFCFASVIKWLTKWHMEKKTEYLTRAKYYINLCDNTENPTGLLFSLRMYCILNGFMKKDAQSCFLMDVCSLILKGDKDSANYLLLKGWADEH